MSWKEIEENEERKRGKDKEDKDKSDFIEVDCGNLFN